MRKLILLIASLLAASASTQVMASSPTTSQPSESIPASGPSTSPTPDTTILTTLQQRLLDSQKRIALLERELADSKTRAAELDVCRTKNGELVAIAYQLIDGYEHRYRVALHNDPFQLGRRRFEAELQTLSDAVYDRHADVPVSTRIAPATKASQASVPQTHASSAQEKNP